MWIINNLDVIIGIICLVSVAGFGVYQFALLGKDKQIDKIKEWLLFAVIQAEQQLGGGTGRVKLRFVYDMFVDKFKVISLLISFEDFSLMVDEALDIMRDMLESNEAIKQYVEKK